MSGSAGGFSSPGMRAASAVLDKIDALAASWKLSATERKLMADTKEAFRLLREEVVSYRSRARKAEAFVAKFKGLVDETNPENSETNHEQVGA